MNLSLTPSNVTAPFHFALSAVVFQEDAVEIRPIPDCPKEHTGDRILIRCQAIKYVIHFHNTVGGVNLNSCLKLENS